MEHVRSVLGKLLFSGEAGLKKTENLSGGEAARLFLAEAHPGQEQHRRPRRADQPPRRREHRRAPRGAHRVQGHGHRRRATIATSCPGWATRVLELSAKGPRLFNGTYDDFLEGPREPLEAAKNAKASSTFASPEPEDSPFERALQGRAQASFVRSGHGHGGYHRGSTSISTALSTELRPAQTQRTLGDAHVPVRGVVVRRGRQLQSADQGEPLLDPGQDVHLGAEERRVGPLQGCSENTQPAAVDRSS